VGGGGLNFMVVKFGFCQQMWRFSQSMVYSSREGLHDFCHVLGVLMGLFIDKFVSALSSSIWENYFKNVS